MRFYFIGGIFPPRQAEFIRECSVGVVQNAANAFQLNLLRGFDQLCGGVENINLPFVGSYPKRFKQAEVPGCTDKLFDATKVTGVRFSNLAGWKHVSRFLNLLREMRTRSWSSADCCVIYSLHLPFLAAAGVVKRCNPGMRICVVVPDLPEYMSDSPGIIRRLFKALDTRLLNFFLGQVDHFVLLTEAMATRLRLEQSRYVVVEGISSECPANGNAVPSAPEAFSLCYTGTLAGRYGIRDLVDAVRRIDNPDLQLWICGDGDSREYVQKAADEDRRIRFFGQLGHAEVLALQQRATVLINPRGAEGEYTRYSFPSKVLEYMSSGRPTIMHRLAGIPDEYYDYCFCAGEPGVPGLMQCIQQAIEQDPQSLNALGARAREFVLTEKSAAIQVQRIIDLVSSEARSGSTPHP